MTDSANPEFIDRYGPWALIAGGAQGIGAAYAHYVAARGVNVALLDVNGEALALFAAEIEASYGVECLGIEVDLARDDLLDCVIEGLAGREIGLLVYNAGLADFGPFYKADTGLDLELTRLAINVKGPLLLTYHFAKPMLARRSGGVILMSSGAGWQGAPYYSHYAATKAYDIVLAESLWYEFKPYHVDVLACAAGMTLSTASAGYQHLDTSNMQTTTELVAEAMAALGEQPSLIAGEFNRDNHKLLQSLPRDQMISAMARHPIENFLGGEVPEQNLD